MFSLQEMALLTILAEVPATVLQPAGDGAFNNSSRCGVHEPIFRYNNNTFGQINMRMAKSAFIGGLVKNWHNPATSNSQSFGPGEEVLPAGPGEGEEEIKTSKSGEETQTETLITDTNKLVYSPGPRTKITENPEGEPSINWDSRQTLTLIWRRMLREISQEKYKIKHEQLVLYILHFC